ncbi:MAG: roadblock/LC7 domain-containing protein [Candidatus Helarchaeota archaeon]|nr:roadblock/LC7 domain-containing protein [Candidatus Helarchaeota archaeon]
MSDMQEIEKKISIILRRVANEVQLHTLALVTKEGRRIAYYSQMNVDADLLSAMVASILAMGEQTIRQMQQGELGEIVVRGTQGYTIVSCAGEGFLMIGAGPATSDLGMTVSVLRDYSKMIGEILKI